MKLHAFSWLPVLLPAVAIGQNTLQSPEQFLGYELGDRFTRHHRVVDYFTHVDETVTHMKVTSYGETYEKRPLIYAVVTSPENFARLEEIRVSNQRRAGLADGQPSNEKIALVWLSYNVHGNEASSTEAAMKTLYDLVNPANSASKDWLRNTVVIIDPCINPDGRDRYANFYNQYGHSPPNPATDSKEHQEDWPGGRTNHYLFDLNRDWAWGTQVESKSRIKVYNEWMPHVHVDFHEQGHNDPYFFAPAVEPFHEVITTWQREFQTIIGKNHARYFDEKGWLYFTKEVFDLYYPSYGDTYPTFNGAIGMTYEQGGGPAGGLKVTTREGDPLTLKDRVMHHHTTSLSTIEVTSLNAAKVVDEFEKYFRENVTSPPGVYKTYVIKSDNNPDKLSRLTKWMDGHLIRYGHPAGGKALRGFDFQSQTVTNFNMTSDDLVLSVFQPKSRFVTTLFEPQSRLPDSATYDITAWNLVYNYDLKAYAVPERINVVMPFKIGAANFPSVPDKPYAYLFKYHDLQDVGFLTALLRSDIKVRCAIRAFTVEGQPFDPGTLIVPRRNNEAISSFDEIVRTTASAMGRNVYSTRTGFVDKGKDLGSDYVSFIKAPRVAVLVGDQTSPQNAGEVWFFFERQLNYPITQIDTDYLKVADLRKYDILIIPDGSYRIFDEPTLESLSNWVSSGGKLIITGNGLTSFADKKGFALKAYTTEAEKTEAEKKEKEMKEKNLLRQYEDDERRQISDGISGAIYKVEVDHSHPLAFGLRDTYFTLKTSELRFGFVEGGWNVGVLKGVTRPVQGFAGYRINQKISNTLVFGVEDKGQGKVIYLVDNPLFRCFWETGKMLFSNAVFMVEN